MCLFLKNNLLTISLEEETLDQRRAHILLSLLPAECSATLLFLLNHNHESISLDTAAGQLGLSVPEFRAALDRLAELQLLSFSD